jgi:hypothetical protein
MKEVKIEMELPMVHPIKTTKALLKALILITSKPSNMVHKFKS